MNGIPSRRTPLRSLKREPWILILSGPKGKSLDFLKSRCMTSPCIKCYVWWLFLPYRISLRVFVDLHEHRCLISSESFRVVSWEESVSHPFFLCKRECPKSRHHLASGPTPSEFDISKIKLYTIDAFLVLTMIISNDFLTVFTSGFESDDWRGRNAHNFVNI